MFLHFTGEDRNLGILRRLSDCVDATMFSKANPKGTNADEVAESRGLTV